jgi:hypothetical protein
MIAPYVPFSARDISELLPIVGNNCPVAFGVSLGFGPGLSLLQLCR